MDVVAPKVRSRMMANIRSKNTSQEIRIRKALHALGFRFHLHRKDLPGTPDITLPRYRAAVFVHGCFWHGHDCPLFKFPSTNADKWKRKILTNQRRDVAAVSRLLESDWRVCTIWECALRGRTSYTLRNIIDLTAKWIQGGQQTFELRGKLDE